MWQSGEVPQDWRKANSIFKKSKEEDPGNCGPISLTLIPGTVTKQLIPETTSRHMKDKEVIWSSQHAFMKGKSCLTVIAFHNDASLQMIQN